MLWLGGDVFLTYATPERLAPLADRFAGPGFVNLEGPVGAPGERGTVARTDGRVVLRHGEDALAALRASGVRALGLANNHRDDGGPEGRSRTRAAVEAHGLVPVDERGAVIRLADGRRVALTAHLVTDAVPTELAEALRTAASGADALVVTLHGTHDGEAPTTALMDAVDMAIAAGARAVAVHGAHALGRVERRRGAVVALGLGNLLFDCDCTDGTDGLLLNLELFPDGTTGAGIVPVRAGLFGEPARPSPDADRVFDRLEALGSAPLVRGDGEAVF